MHLFYHLIVKQQKYVLETGGCQVDACPGEYSILFVTIFAHIHQKKKKQSMCLENIIIVCMFLYSFSFQLFTQIH